MGSHHSEIERHISLFSSLYELVACLCDKASAFGGEIRVSIVKLQDIAQNLHIRLELVDSGAVSFTC